MGALRFTSDFMSFLCLSLPRTVSYTGSFDVMGLNSHCQSHAYTFFLKCLFISSLMNCISREIIQIRYKLRRVFSQNLIQVPYRQTDY